MGNMAATKLSTTRTCHWHAHRLGGLINFHMLIALCIIFSRTIRNAMEICRKVELTNGWVPSKLNIPALYMIFANCSLTALTDLIPIDQYSSVSERLTRNWGFRPSWTSHIEKFYFQQAYIPLSLRKWLILSSFDRVYTFYILGFFLSLAYFDTHSDLSQDIMPALQALMLSFSNTPLSTYQL